MQPGAVPAAEEHRRAVRRGDRRQVGLARAASAFEHRGEQRPRTRRGALRVGALHRDGDDLGVVVAGAVVEHDADVAVLPELDRLAPVRADVGEAHRPQQRLRLGRRRGVDADLHEREPVEGGARRQLVLQHDQRAHRVDRGAVGVGLAEDVVEHLERERPGVAGGEHAAQEAGEVERALAREAAVVPAPLQDVHAQVRGVGELEEEELVGRDRSDRVQSGAAREDVEGVQAHAQGGVVARLGDPPRVVVLGDVAAPGERLVGDAQPALGGAPGERVQLLGGERVVVDRLGRDVRADQHRRRAELLHDVELRLGAVEVALERGLRDRLEVPERLVEVDRQAELRGRVPHVGRSERRVDQVGLEQLDSVEAGARRGGELLVERAAQADGGDRAAHHACRDRFVDELGEVPQHPLPVRLDAGEQRERVRGLEHGHPAAVDRAAAELARRAQQRCLERAVDHLGDPQAGVQQVLVERQAGVGVHAGGRRVDEAVGAGEVVERAHADAVGSELGGAVARPVLVDVDDAQPPHAEPERGVGDGRAGAARAEHDDVVERHVRQAAREGLGEAGGVRVVADRAVAARTRSC